MVTREQVHDVLDAGFETVKRNCGGIPFASAIVDAIHAAFDAVVLDAIVQMLQNPAQMQKCRSTGLRGSLPPLP